MFRDPIQSSVAPVRYSAPPCVACSGYCLPYPAGRLPTRRRSMNTPASQSEPRIEMLSAVTLATRDMARSVRFYRSLGFKLKYGGEVAQFTLFTPGLRF